jgi:agmatinase
VSDQDKPAQPVSGTEMPRYAGPATFARLPELRDVPRCDVAVLGVPFDAGTSYHPGARFGPLGIRQASRHLRTQFHPAYGTEPFVEQQVADAGDVACNPFNIEEAMGQIRTAATGLLGRVGAIVTMGGDHTIALPLLRAVNHHLGPVALVHFDAHLDNRDSSFGAPRVVNGWP